ncbi:helix-turn-helix transcriptional regulator [Spirosoma radiotolerans]|uniref:helix-turn-helix transcriptional regulator n=1 Tax=Spirosoma radiotolerans TaxID=1379870 RepID=UPI00130D8322|nr:AraC family transcriptional regulator [Spirosoma radiotolerans]
MISLFLFTIQFVWAGTVVSIVVPNWWHNWWAYVLYALLAILLLRFYVRLRVQQALAQQERVAQQRHAEQQRNRFDHQPNHQALPHTPFIHAATTGPIDAARQVNLRLPETSQQPEAPAPTSPFLEDLQTLLRVNFSNPQFGVEEMAQAMGLSRVHLYRKIKASSGLTASELLRNYRLTKAKDLLRLNHTITETAFAVGFDSPAYFAKCFRDMYKVTPSDFQTQEKSSHTSP